MDEDITYRALMDRLRRERATADLLELPLGFHERTEARLDALADAFRDAQAGGAPAAATRALLEEATTLRRLRDEWYDLRERKLVMAALIAARGEHVGEAGMASVEAGVFRAVVAALRHGRARGGPEGARGPAAAEPAPLGPLEGPPRAGEGGEPDAAPPARVSEATLVRVTRAVGPFVAPDLRTYRLHAEDVVALPRNAAALLVGRGDAVPLNSMPTA